MKKQKIAIIGSGFSGLSAACYLAKQGNDVSVYEKNSIAGGRARQYETDEGFVFDMGPSWYWMPDIIEDFFTDFGYKSSDFYELISLNPQFDLVFEDGLMSVPKDLEAFYEMFDNIEPGAGKKARKFMDSARLKYEIGMQNLVNKPAFSWLEFCTPAVVSNAFKLDLLTDFRSYVKRYFKNEKLQALMEFPVIFLGAAPQNIPALYSLMNYGGYALGTWYPIGGFYELVKAMQKIAEDLGVRFHFNAEVEEIVVSGSKAKALKVNDEVLEFDAVVASSDYHHSETLLPKAYRNYEEKYWESRTFAPSALIFYLGIDEEIPELKHHTLFFEPDFDRHIQDIYKDKEWPKEPLFYVCNPSKTDPNVAPKGTENLFLLLPISTGINDEENVREHYLKLMLNRIEKLTGAKDLYSKIIYKRSYCVSDFVNDYHAYGGNAYGLANTLKQTAVLKPTIKNKKINNLYYTGQLTVPGPGVPPSIISGRIVADELMKIK